MIYFIYNPKTKLIKIGTTKDYHARLSSLTAEHGRLDLLGLMDGSYIEESALHQQFVNSTNQGQSGREWFRDTPELRAFIDANTHLRVPERTKSLYFRVSSRTQRALAIMAGKMQAERQVPISADEALWTMILAYDPDAAQKAATAATEEEEPKRRPSKGE